VIAGLSIDLAPTEPIARQITRALRQAIVTMRLRPGEMLSEQEIASKFGVSRQPVREAFIKLSEAGLIQVLPQRGTLVVKISRAAVEDARFIRQAVECAVVREVAATLTRSGMASLSDSLAEQRRAGKAKDAEAFFALDEGFHRLLAELAGRPSAWRVVEDVKPQMDRVRFIDMTDAMPMRVLIDQHGAIIAALKAGDPDAAEAAMRDHLSEIVRSLPRVAQQHADLFEDGGR
jgi:DNA-binding GntR family transcriptional regulator